MNSQKLRPKNLNLLSIKFPLFALISIGHRIAGVVLFLLLPYFVYLFYLAVSGEAGFLWVQAQFQQTWIKILMTGSLWALGHHIITGVRHFLLDLDVAMERHQVHYSALVIFLLDMLFAVGVVMALWF